jgi:hypothetical protein
MTINPLSLLAAAATNQLTDSEPLFIRQYRDFAAHLSDDSLWIVATWPDGAVTALGLLCT